MTRHRGSEPAPGSATPGPDSTPGLDTTPGPDSTPGLDTTPGPDSTPGLDTTPGPDRTPGGDQRPVLRVNPIACQAHGLCIELLPELIAADPWGYPVITPGPVPVQLFSLARRAVSACPTLALLLTRPQ